MYQPKKVCMMKPNLPSIYEYNDFRKFIADYQQAAQEADRTYTKSRMSQLLGLPNSRSFLSDVLRDKPITATFIERFIRLFAFDNDKANFFRTLVKFNQATNPSERELCFEQLISLNKTPKKYLYQKSYRYYKDWYNAALRALLNVYDFDGKDFHALGRKLVPEVPVPKIKKAFELLLQMELIDKNKQGFYKPTTSAISTEEFVRDEILKQFQLKCLDLARMAVVNESGLPQIIATNTVSVSKTGLKRIEKQIERFRSQVRSLVHKDEGQPETVYQINLQFFPMMK
jgi:uncharacterized protein (TIGR02147 family)